MNAKETIGTYNRKIEILKRTGFTETEFAEKQEVFEKKFCVWAAVEYRQTKSEETTLEYGGTVALTAATFSCYYSKNILVSDRIRLDGKTWSIEVVKFPDYNITMEMECLLVE